MIQVAVRSCRDVACVHGRIYNAFNTHLCNSHAHHQNLMPLFARRVQGSMLSSCICPISNCSPPLPVHQQACGMGPEKHQALKRRALQEASGVDSVLLV